MYISQVRNIGGQLSCSNTLRIRGLEVITMTKRKYKPTNKIESLADFEKSDATWFEVSKISKSGRKMWHKGALISLQVRTLQKFIDLGVYECEKLEEQTEDNNA
jgi:hypothetical protein